MLGAAVAVPLRPASAAETESTAQSLSRACLLVGRDALVAGCLDWALLTTAEVGWAPHRQAATERDVRMVSSKLFLLTLLFFIATVIFFIQSGILTWMITTDTWSSEVFVSLCALILVSCLEDKNLKGAHLMYFYKKGQLLLVLFLLHYSAD